MPTSTQPQSVSPSTIEKPLSATRPFQLQRLGVVMEPEAGNPMEAEGVLNPASARGRDGQLYLFPRLVARGNYSRTGMARVVSYDDQGPEHRPRIDRREHDAISLMADFSIQTHMTMGMAMAQNARNNFGVMWDIGWNHEMTGEPERHDGGPLHAHEHEGENYEVDVMWQRYISPRWSAMAGYRFSNQEDTRDRAFAGVMHVLPGMFMASATVDSQGDARLSLAKNFQLTSRLAAFGRVEYDTNTEWDWSAGATYTLSQRVSLITQYDSDHGFGGGLSFRF